MNVLRTLNGELFAVSQETSIFKAKRYESGCEDLAERLHCIMRVGGSAHSPLGPLSPWLPNDPILERIRQTERGSGTCGGPHAP